jgi:hypothetical protein
MSAAGMGLRQHRWCGRPEVSQASLGPISHRVTPFTSHRAALGAQGARWRRQQQPCRSRTAPSIQCVAAPELQIEKGGPGSTYGNGMVAKVGRSRLQAGSFGRRCPLPSWVQQRAGGGRARRRQDQQLKLKL